MIIETYAYARAGLLGNPSDGYFGKTIALICRNWRARVIIYPSARLEIRPGKADQPVFESLDELYRTTRWRGYYGGVRLIQALLMRLQDYCKSNGVSLPERNFTIEYESTVPLRLGLGGSSAILTAALRGLLRYFSLSIPLPVQANLVLESETKELGVPAGLQDRVVQAYEGLIFMDFAREHMDRQGYGEYHPLDPALLPPLYIAYRTSLSEGTEVVHNNLRERWRAGEPRVVDAMRIWAGYAEQGRHALIHGDHETLHLLIDANFNLRASLYDVGHGNTELIETARRCGTTANLTGSGGAIVGTYPSEVAYQELQAAMNQIGASLMKPLVQVRESASSAAV